MEIIIITWIIAGILSVIIYNKVLTYENVYVKITWNILCFLCGYMSFLLSILTFISSKIK